MQSLVHRPLAAYLPNPGLQKFTKAALYCWRLPNLWAKSEYSYLNYGPLLSLM